MWAHIQEAIRDDAAGIGHPMFAASPSSRDVSPMDLGPHILIILAPPSTSMVPIIRQVQSLLASGVPGAQGALSSTGVVDVFDQSDPADMLAKTVSGLDADTYICRVSVRSDRMPQYSFATDDTGDTPCSRSGDRCPSGASYNATRELPSGQHGHQHLDLFWRVSSKR